MSVFLGRDASAGAHPAHGAAEVHAAAEAPAADDPARVRTSAQFALMEEYFQSADQNKNGILEKGELQSVVDNKSNAVSPAQREGAQLFLSKFDDIRTLAEEGSKQPFASDLDGIASTYNFDSLYRREKSDDGISLMDITAARIALRPESEANRAIAQLRTNLKWSSALQGAGSVACFIGGMALIAAPEPSFTKVAAGVLLGVGAGSAGTRAYRSFVGSDADQVADAIARVRVTVNSWDLK